MARSGREGNPSRALSHNSETERSLLGGLMLDSSQVSDVASRLRPEDFHRPAHQQLFTLIFEIVERDRVADYVSIVDEADKRGVVEQLGGISYLLGLPQACPSVANVPIYVERVREHAVRRRLQLAAETIIEQVQEGASDLSTLLDGAESSVFAVSQLSGNTDWTRINSVVDEQMAEITRRANNPSDLTGVTTGFVDLDKKLTGWQKGDLVILAARPAMGKTALALNFALHAAKTGGVGVGVFSLEMSKEQLVTRLLTSEARVDAGRVRTGQLDPIEDWPKLGRAAEVLHGLPIFIDDSSGLTISALRSKARRLRSECKNLGLIIVDYLQLMQGSGGAKESRENVISAISRGLKILAKELGIPVVALSQLNRSLESREDKRPLPSDLRESGAIEQDADIILFIYRDEVYNEDSPDKGVAEVIVAKHRAGAIGRVKLAFQGQYTLFQNLAHAPDEGPDYY
jgi:replicative DNA helicase